MGDEDEDEEMTEVQAPAEQPAAQTGAGAKGCAPAAAVNAEIKPAEPDMSLVGVQSMAGCMAAGFHLHPLLHNCFEGSRSRLHFSNTASALLTRRLPARTAVVAFKTAS